MITEKINFDISNGRVKNMYVVDGIKNTHLKLSESGNLKKLLNGCLKNNSNKLYHKLIKKGMVMMHN